MRMNDKMKKIRNLRRKILKLIGKEFKVINYIERENKEIIAKINNDIKKNKSSYTHINESSKNIHITDSM